MMRIPEIPRRQPASRATLKTSCSRCSLKTEPILVHNLFSSAQFLPQSGFKTRNLTGDEFRSKLSPESMRSALPPLR